MAIHFLHIGKTGGMSIRAALAPVAERIKFYDHNIKLTDISAGERVFFILRDPVARFVSGFNSRMRKGQPAFFKEWTAGEADAFAKFAKPNELAEALPDADARAAMRAIGHLRAPQRSWVPDLALLGTANIVWIGFTETLADDFEQIKRRLDLPRDLRLPDDPVLAHRSPEGVPTELSVVGRHNVKQWYAGDYELIAACREVRSTL